MPRLPPRPFGRLKPSARTLTALVLCALLLLLLGTLKNYRGPTRYGPAQPPPDPHLARGQLLCALEDPADPANSSAPAFRVTITNMHPSTTVSVLLRDSPFADDAVESGAFDVRESAPPGAWIVRAEEAAGDDGPLPFVEDDFVDILPFHAMTKDIFLGLNKVTLRSERNYTVQARGRWRAVWHARLEDYDYGYLQKLGGASGLIDWTYASNTLEITVP
jgi:hypothetical protein